MDPTVLLFIGYKALGICAGLIFGYWGYRLFIEEKVRSAGTLEAQYKGFILNLKRFGPGSFFAIFGAGIISFVIYAGIEFQADWACDKISKGVKMHIPEKLPMIKPATGDASR